MTAVFGGTVGALVLLIALRFVSRAVRPTRRPGTPNNGAAGGVSADAMSPVSKALGCVRRRTNAYLQHRRAGRGASADAVALWADALARRLRSGDTLREAVQHEIPDNDVLAALTDEIRHGLARGQSLPEAARSLHRQQLGRDANVSHPWQHLDLVCAVIGAAADLGGSAAAPLDRVSAALRLRAADRQERSAQSAQARLSAHVLTIVPVGILCLLAATDPDVRAVIISPAGMSTVTVGLLLNGAGWLWMRHIVGVRA